MEKSNYLKNYRPTLYFFRDRYGLKVSEIEFLFFVYDLKYFTYMYVNDNYRSSRSFVDRNIPKIKDKGFIYIYQEQYMRRVRKYCISQKGKMLVSRFYRILEGKELINKDYLWE